MYNIRRNCRSPLLAPLGLLGMSLFGISQSLFDARASEPSSAPAEASAAESPNIAATLDRTGRVRLGKASFYAARFGGRKMADGTRMQLQGDNAASKTLPLGTTAVVTNLETGLAAVVTIRDRGPYVAGRIVDLSPATANRIGLEPKQGVVRVAVSPISVPLPDGRVKLMAGRVPRGTASRI